MRWGIALHRPRVGGSSTDELKHRTPVLLPAGPVPVEAMTDRLLSDHLFGACGSEKSFVPPTGRRWRRALSAPLYLAAQSCFHRRGVRWGTRTSVYGNGPVGCRTN